MLPSRERVQERQGKEALPRHEYLQQLVDNFQCSRDIRRKEEVVAHLANFAYAPINYTSFSRLCVMDLFLDILAADQEEQDVRKAKASTTSSPPPSRKRLLVEFALGGICNCIIDPRLQQQFIDGDGVDLLAPYILDTPSLSSEQLTSITTSELNIRVSALSTAYFLLDSSAFLAITSSTFIVKIQSLQHHVTIQIANTASAFLSYYQELLVP